MLEAAPNADPLVLVTGSGRSGTSSLAGTLDKLGLAVPGPLVPPGPINPKGFFENSWVVEFHSALLRQALVRSSDASPRAPERVAAALAGGDALRTLEEWLGRRESGPTVVKDNQACWFVPLWQEAGTRVGRETALLTSVRHPAEVVGSRDRAWGSGREEAERRARETANVAAWLNVLLVTERAGRGRPRAFVRFEDLLGDWRGETRRIADQLGVALTVPDVPHELDEWLDADMRTPMTWDDITVPAPLLELAERAWEASLLLVSDPSDTGAQVTFDEVAASYRTMYDDAAALSVDELRHARKLSARTASDKVRRRLRAKLAQQAEAPPRPWWRRR